MIVSTPRESIWAWMNTRLRIAWSDDFRGIGIVDKRCDCLKAAVGYNTFVGRACFMHGAIDDPSVVTRTFREAILEYPFRDLRLECVFGLVDETSTRMRDMAERLGFKETSERFKGSGTAGADLILVRLYREEWKASYEFRRRRSESP